MKAIDPKATADYILESDRGEDVPAEEKAVAEITQLSAQEDAYIKDRIHNLGEVQLAALALGLAKVRNFNVNGKEFVLERDMSRAPLVGKKRPFTDECLSRIPKEARDEWAGVILSNKLFKGAEAKNS